MGALTSKPYAFIARPWELRSVENLDFSDFLASRVRIDLRGLEVMRILPCVSNNFGVDEWITDRARFSYDGLKRQRLIYPFKWQIELDIRYALSWEQILPDLDAYLSVRPSVMFSLGGQVDILTTLIVRDLAFLLGTDDHGVMGYSYLPRSDFRWASVLDMETIGRAEFISFLYFNPRMHMPLLNSSLRRRVLSGGLVVVSFGQAAFSNYSVLEGGLGYLDFAAGKNLLSTYVARSIRPAFLVGPTDSVEATIPFFSLLSSNVADVYSFFVQPSIASFGFMELGLNSSFFDFNSDIDETHIHPKIFAPLLYSIDCDRLGADMLSFLIKVYQGHHGDKAALNAHFIFPACGPYEADSVYVDSQGSIKSSAFLLTPPVSARSHWQILLAVWAHYSERQTSSFVANYFSLSGRYERVSSVLPLLSIPSLSIVSSDDLNYLSSESLFMFEGYYRGQFNNNFYLVDVISRASRNMALASSRFRPFRELNFI